ncbi:leucine-zipper-like transcriptional regulator 1 homolog isoform X2 [Brachyhypopomus gauderio]
MVAHQAVLYVFGGLRCSAYSNSETPLWMFDTATEQWLHSKGKMSSSQNIVPSNRKGHSAVVLGSSMFVYGGYNDMQRTLQEFWRYNLDSREWELLSNGQVGPGPRHSHSVMAHRDSMYLYGGLQGLKEQRDLWRFQGQNWSCIRALSGPSKLMGHSAVVYKDSMLVFGGGLTQSAPSSCMWKFNLTTLNWEKLPSLAGCTAPRRIHHCSVGLGPSFQPGPSSANINRQEISTSSRVNKPRPFNNKCFPYSRSAGQPGEGIELQTIRSGETYGLKDLSLDLEGTETQGNCLTTVNQQDVRERGDSETSAETEDSMEQPMEQPMPNLLLILGGKPLKEHTDISVWQMTLADC